MATGLIAFLIAVIIICVLAAVILWAVQRFFPDIYEPARYIVGAIALIAILLKLMPLAGHVF